MSSGYFYILLQKDGKFYYGSTKNIKTRIERHLSGISNLRHKLPLKLIYFEAYTSYTLARKREMAVKKNAAMREELKNRII